MAPYIFGYVHGRRLVRRWLGSPDRRDRVRRLLTERHPPADLDRSDGTASSHPPPAGPGKRTGRGAGTAPRSARRRPRGHQS
ncbi:hypothetical protein GCM10010517_12640 [Streptosporangium fragile]|uniref:Uncharacterized protein n=1 Tax=Streptosporangium fragile TaxID=46186 RepID=A0ABN3VSD8_9ACTN